MPKVTSLGHMGVHVRDIERSVAFYRDILGLTSATAARAAPCS